MKRSFQPAMTAVMRNWTFWTGLLTLVVGMISIPASMASATILVPGDLEVGDTYHLAFVTDGKTTAESTNIDDYNSFVQAQAGLSGATTENYGINWYAIASTASAEARNNAVVSGPVFLLDETKIADNYNDMWNGNLDSALALTQFEVIRNLFVWSGTWEDGTAFSYSYSRPGGHIGYVLGGSSGHTSVGDSAATDDNWISYASIKGQSSSWHLYALSEALTVPIPEPSTGLLSLVGLAGCILARSRRRSARG